MTAPSGPPTTEGAAAPSLPSGPPALPGAPARLARLKVVGILLLALGVGADLWSKQVLQDHLVLHNGEPSSEKVVDVVPGFFALEGVWNPGVTFGLAPGRTTEILVLTSVATLGLLTWLLATRNPSRLLHVGLGLIISGALGNLYDRLRWHKVRDFFLIYLGDLEPPSRRTWTWPNFNVADACIVVGVCLVVFDTLFGASAERSRAAAARPTAPGPEAGGGA